MMHVRLWGDENTVESGFHTCKSGRKGFVSGVLRTVWLYLVMECKIHVCIRARRNDFILPYPCYKLSSLPMYRLLN